MPHPNPPQGGNRDGKDKVFLLCTKRRLPPDNPLPKEGTVRGRMKFFLLYTKQRLPRDNPLPKEGTVRGRMKFFLLYTKQRLPHDNPKGGNRDGKDEVLSSIHQTKFAP